MVWGGIGAGKTTLIRALQGGSLVCKTQMVEYAGEAIDTPGEYSETGRLARHLLSTSQDAAMMLVVQDATRDDSHFPPNYFQMFHQPVVGVVTKMDAPQANPARAASILRGIGVADEVFFVSAVTGCGLSELRQAIQKRRVTWQATTATVVKRLA